MVQKCWANPMWLWNPGKKNPRNVSNINWLQDFLPSTGWLEFTTRRPEGVSFQRVVKLHENSFLIFLKSILYLTCWSHQLDYGLGNWKKDIEGDFQKLLLTGTPRLNVPCSFCEGFASVALRPTDCKPFQANSLLYKDYSIRIARGSLTYQITIWGDQLAVLLRFNLPRLNCHPRNAKGSFGGVLERADGDTVRTGAGVGVAERLRLR